MDRNSVQRLIPGAIVRFCENWCRWDRSGQDFPVYYGVVKHVTPRGGVLVRRIEFIDAGCKVSIEDEWVIYSDLLPNTEATSYEGNNNPNGVIRALRDGVSFVHVREGNVPPDKPRTRVGRMTPEGVSRIVNERMALAAVYPDEDLPTELAC